MEINFFAVENFTAYGRKNIFIRMKMEFHAYGNFTAYGRKFFSMREEENFLAGRNKFSPV